MHIQGVHGQVVGVQVERLKERLHGDLLAFQFVHHTVGVHTIRLLNEAQQVFLVHAGGSVDVSVNLEKSESRDAAAVFRH